VNMSTFQGRGMMPTTTGDYGAYADSSTVDVVSTASEQRRPVVRQSSKDKLYKPFHYLLLLYLFFYCSRIAELIPYLHIGMILQPILLIGMIITGRVTAILRMPLGKVLIAFALWITICVPFSVWRGGSFVIFLIVFQALALVFFMAAFIRTIPDCFRAMLTVALAMAAVGVLAILVGGGKTFHGVQDTRLGLGGGTDTLSDANFLCLYILIGLPFLWLSASLKTGFKKVLLLSLMIPMLAGAARTGSRMGLLVLAVGLLLFLVFASVKQRVLAVVGMAVFFVLALLLLPQRITDRFTTYFDASNSPSSLEAAQSAEARKAMLIRSVELTVEHPLFGVGPGEFMDAEAAEAADEGKRGMWHYTHNSYTEVSSETGITGLILFVFAFFGAYRGLSSTRSKYPDVRVRRAALFTQMAIVMTAIGAFFLSIGYGGIVPPIVAISATFQAAVANKLRQTRLQAAENPR
jgi:O-antigen ligase